MDQSYHKSMIVSVGSVLSVDRPDNLFFEKFAFYWLKNLVADELWVRHIALILDLLSIKCNLTALKLLFFVDHN